MVNVSDYKLWSMLDRYVEGARAHDDHSSVSDIGVDETSLKRGHNALELSSLKLKTVRALHLRESFQDIYEGDSVEEFEMLLDKWYYWATHSRLEPFKKVARTIKQHRDGIVRWMSTKVTNGILEGFNSLIQAAKRKARGYRTTKTFTIIAYLLTGKLDFSPLNPNIRPT